MISQDQMLNKELMIILQILNTIKLTEFKILTQELDHKITVKDKLN